MLLECFWKSTYAVSSSSRFKRDNLVLFTAYGFVLERCQSISVEVEATDASNAVLDALSSFSMLKSVKQLTVTVEGDCGINGVVGVQFYDACPNLQVYLQVYVISIVTASPSCMDICSSAGLANHSINFCHVQVVSLTGFFVQLSWRPRPSIRHIELETSIALLEFTDWQAFPHLETLELCAWRLQSLCNQCSIDCIDLDLSSAQTLGRLEIENWSPKNIKVAAGCRVYAVWQPPATASVTKNLKIHSWLQSPCWRAPGTNLAALHIEHLMWHHADAIQLSAFCAILECQHELETLRIEVLCLGSSVMLLNMLFPYFKGMKTPLRVDICTEAGCYLTLDETLCLSKTLVLNMMGPVLVLVPMQAAPGNVVLDVLDGYNASDAKVRPSLT